MITRHFILVSSNEPSPICIKLRNNEIAEIATIEATSFNFRLEKSTVRSEEHTSELQSLAYLVCRLLLEKKKKTKKNETRSTNPTNSTPTTSSPPHSVLYHLSRPHPFSALPLPSLFACISYHCPTL